MPPRRLRAQLIQRKAMARPPPTSPTTASAGTGTSRNSSTPVWPSAMIVCWTGPRLAPGASMGTRTAVSSRRPAPSTRASTCAASTKGAPVIRCLVPLRRQPSPSGVSVASSASASEPARGSVRAKATLVRPARKSPPSRSRAAGLQWSTIGLGPSVQASIHCTPRRPCRYTSSCT